jgi:transcriptional regulator with XRE-family HTH domain
LTTAPRLTIRDSEVNYLGIMGVNTYDWRVRVHDLIAKGAAEARRRNRWTQEQAANVYRSHGLRAWRTSTVGSLEAGLRRPRLEEVLLMARALGVTVDQLIPGGDDERVELGDDAVVSPRWIREMIRGVFYREDRPLEEMPYEKFPLDEIMAEVRRRAQAEEEHDAPLMEAINEWAEQRGIELMAGDLFASHKRPSDTERHAAQRLGAGVAPLKLASRALWDHRNFDDERDRRVGGVDQLEPRSRQARRGRVTREMLAELRALFEEIKADQAADGDGER